MALEHWLIGEPLTARSPSTAQLILRWLRKNVRAAAWVLFIGVLSGVVGPLGLGLLVLRSFDSGFSIARAISPHNQWEVPWLTSFHWSLVPDWVVALLMGGGLLLFLASGWLLQRTIRPHDRWADVLTGMATGAVAGLTAYVLVMGPLNSVNTAVLKAQPGLDDLQEAEQIADLSQRGKLLGFRGAESEELAWMENDLVSRHPGLEQLSDPHYQIPDEFTRRDHRQVFDLYAHFGPNVGWQKKKLTVEYVRVNYQVHMVDEIVAGCWWSVFSTMLGAMTACILSAAVAGFFVRREYRNQPGHGITPWLAALLPYVELLGFSMAFLLIPIMDVLWILLPQVVPSQGILPMLGVANPPLAIVCLLVPWTIALIAVFRKWSGLTRWTVYFVWIVLCDLAGYITGVLEPSCSFSLAAAGHLGIASPLCTCTALAAGSAAAPHEPRNTRMRKRLPRSPRDRGRVDAGGEGAGFIPYHRTTSSTRSPRRDREKRRRVTVV